jgi:hypothetical protein
MTPVVLDARSTGETQVKVQSKYRHRNFACQAIWPRKYAARFRWGRLAMFGSHEVCDSQTWFHFVQFYSSSLKFCRNGAIFGVFTFPVDEPSESLGQPVD